MEENRVGEKITYKILTGEKIGIDKMRRSIRA